MITVARSVPIHNFYVGLPETEYKSVDDMMCIRYYVLDGKTLFFASDVCDACDMSISQRKRRVKKMKESDSDGFKITSVISHELRNVKINLVTRVGLMEIAFVSGSENGDILIRGIESFCDSILIKQTELSTRKAIESEHPSQCPDDPSAIYAIYDEKDDTLLYIGRSKDPERRFKTHMNEREKVIRNNELKYIALANIPRERIHMKIMIEDIPADIIVEEEREMIKMLNPPLNALRRDV